MPAARPPRANGEARPQVLRPAGELDVASAPTVFDSAVVLRAGDAVTVDLSRVTFLDASVLGSIVRLRNELVAAGGSLAVTGLTSRHRVLFTIGGLTALM